MFWRGFFLALAAMWAGWILLIWGQTGRPTRSSQWVDDVLRKKLAIARSLPSPKLVVSGGSNVLFGIDARRLSEAVGLPAVNLGVNAALQLPYILHTTRLAARRGDIVLLALEYPDMFVYDGRPNRQFISYLWARDPEFFWQLSLKEKFLVLWDTPLSRVAEGYLASVNRPIRTGLYGVHHLDALGDQTHSSRRDRTAADRAALERTGPKRFAPRDLEDRLAWHYLEAFGAWCRRNGVALFLIPSVIERFPEYLEGERRRFFEEIPRLAKRHGLDFVGEPLAFMYPREDLFNTPYHLTAEARQKHTEKLLRLLRENATFRLTVKRAKADIITPKNRTGPSGRPTSKATE